VLDEGIFFSEANEAM